MSRRPTILLSALVLLAAACSGEPEPTEPPAPRTFDEDGISFTYPAEWDPQEPVSADGVAHIGPAVGVIELSGNLTGLTISVTTIEPPVPGGEEKAYLDAVFERHASVWGDSTVRDLGPAELLGMGGRRFEVDHTARGERLTSSVIVAVRDGSLVTIQCQAGYLRFSSVASTCEAVTATLRVETLRPDSQGNGTA